MQIILALLSAILLSCSTTSATYKVDVFGVDDNLESQIEVNSYKYNKLDIIFNPYDYFFRGYIDKKTKKTYYQVYAVIKNYDWAYYDRVKFLVNGKLETRELKKLGSDVDCSTSSVSCLYFEDVLFYLSAEELKYLTTNPTTLRFVSSSTTAQQDILIDTKEASAFLMKVENAEREILD